ncbi:unnamed protein product [Brachionus calyciflorus]|uniref:Uncharacterized protein n=1 Tax=Brachionus calyciflorus TaxID=104777 RepID=A0A814LX15_9BILA|nr:unnamed protein product [Brachionus calyciflorus]
MKIYNDKIFRTKTSSFKIGDAVIVKQKRNDKSYSVYDQNPYLDNNRFSILTEFNDEKEDGECTSDFSERSEPVRRSSARSRRPIERYGNVVDFSRKKKLKAKQ